jgi:hypothetical protein
MIGNILNKIDKFLGAIFFGNLNTFSYSLFNHYFGKKVLNKKILNENKTIKKFDHDGFAQFKNIDLNKINNLNKELNKQNAYKSSDNRFVYKINNNIKQIIKSIISNDCKNILNDLKKYYSSNIYLGQAMITRNFNYDPTKGESYSSYFHCDGYLCTYFKILINLSDIDTNMGPMNILNKKNTKKSINIFKYNSRNFIKQNKINSEIFINTSSVGSALLVSTPQCLHKAGIPKKDYHRDMLFLIFCAYPNKDENIFSYENEKESTIWDFHSQSVVRKLSKPYGYRRIFKLYNNFIN